MRVERDSQFPVMTEHIKQILIVTGLLTMTALASVVMPSTILKRVFGVENPDAAAIVLARHWGLLVALVGSLLVFAGYRPDIRIPAMVVGATEKLAIGAFVLATPLRRRGVLMMIAAGDALMAIIYLIVLSTS